MQQSQLFLANVTTAHLKAMEAEILGSSLPHNGSEPLTPSYNLFMA